MFFNKDTVNIFNNIKIGKEKINTSTARKNNLPALNWNHSQTIETANRLRSELKDMKLQAQKSFINKTIRDEFGKDIPALTEKVHKKLFPSDGKCHTIAII